MKALKKWRLLIFIRDLLSVNPVVEAANIRHDEQLVKFAYHLAVKCWDMETTSELLLELREHCRTKSAQHTIQGFERMRANQVRLRARLGEDIDQL